MAEVAPNLANGSLETRDLTGSTVGRFQIRARLGAGGMGEVYRAEDTVLKRAVALKRMAPRLRDDPISRKRFLHEAERASRLNDPHIAGLYDVLQENGELFLVMEYIEGETLRHRLNRPMPLSGFLDFAVQCAQALSAAHEHKILHHDIKPENIMLSNTGQAKILDFGVAKEILRLEESPTVSGVSSRSAAFSGTLAYMAPEVLMEEEADGRSDIFSLGVVFYETLTGRHPFQAEGVMATADRIRHDEPAPLSQFIPTAPAELERILGKMLAKNREDRHATAADLVVDLRGLKASAESSDRVVPRRRPLSLRGWRGVSFIGTLVLAAILGWRYLGPEQVLRPELGASSARSNTSKPLKVEVTSPPLSVAQQRYLSAVEAYERGDWQRCIDLAMSAVELEPNYPLAHLYMANAYLLLGNLIAGREHLEQARQSLDRVAAGERERWLVLGTELSERGQYENAARQFRQLVAVYPNYVEGFRGLAEAYEWSGRLEDAIIADRRAVELRPRSPIDNARLLNHLVRQSHFQEAIAYYQKALANGSDGTTLYWPAGLAYLGVDNDSAALRIFERLAKSGSQDYENLAQLCLSRVLMYEGRLSEAADALRTGLVLDEKMKSASWMTVRLYLLASVELLRGQEKEARAAARKLTEAAIKGTNPAELRRAALLNYHLGELTTARKLLERLDTVRKEQESAYANSSYHTVKAALAVASSQRQVARDEVRAAIAFFPSFEAYDVLGEAAKATGDWTAVAAVHEQLLELKGQILTNAFPADWVMAHLDAARAYARAGQSAKALEHYDEFLRIWAHADSDLKVVSEARAEREALGADAAKSPKSPPGE